MPYVASWEREWKREGIREGKREGIKEGIKEKARETAKKMLEDNFRIESIEKYTGLSETEIKSLMN